MRVKIIIDGKELLVIMLETEEVQNEKISVRTKSRYQ